MCEGAPAFILVLGKVALHLPRRYGGWDARRVAPKLVTTSIGYQLEISTSFLPSTPPFLKNFRRYMSTSSI